MVWLSIGMSDMSICFEIVISFSPVRIERASFRLCMPMIETSGMTDASGTFEIGRNIYLYPSSRARIVAGRAPVILRTDPSSASSPRKSAVSVMVASNSYSFPRIPRAIGRSYRGHFFLISAGARFTVIRLPPGKLYHEFLIALRTRSRLS